MSPELLEKTQGERTPLLLIGGKLVEEEPPAETITEAPAHPKEYPPTETTQTSKTTPNSTARAQAESHLSRNPADGPGPHDLIASLIPGGAAPTRFHPTQSSNSAPTKDSVPPEHEAEPRPDPDPPPPPPSFRSAPPLSVKPVQAPPPSAKLKRSIPNNTLRRLFAQAGQQCQSCGNRAGPFEAHHTTPFSEGGTHQLPCLRLLCQACHSLEHQGDFESKAHWAAAKAARCRRRHI